MTDAERIYLDHAATTPVRPEAIEAMLPHFAQNGYNASSVHAMITLFWPARQFHSEKCTSPLGSCTIQSMEASSLATSPLLPVPSPFQPRSFRFVPEAIRMKAFISRRRCTEFTI